LSDPRENWREKAREFAAREIHPRLDAMYREERIHPEIISALARDGFMGLGLGAEWGGRGGGTRDVAAVLEELAAESASVATLLSVHLSVCAQPIAEWGTDAQRREFLPALCAGRALGAFGLTEPGVGSDTARLTCRYRREGDS
ncbi:MAG: acyl-CoA dehydrogenase family protein, partial [Thermoplasmata archaeon]|nr:acyl-CoA dehydrogenase family protein [Thermoplasmata archaeon]